MKTTTVRQIPDDLYQHIQQQAELDRRSVNAQMVYLLEQGAAANDRLRASIQRGLDQSAAGLTRDLGDFTQYATEGRTLWTITGPGITCYGFDLPAARLFSDGTTAERRSADGTMDRRQVAEVSGGRTWLTWDDAFGWIGAGGAARRSGD